MRCKIRIVKNIAGIWTQYMPKLGKVYDAEYIESRNSKYAAPPICVIDILDKKIMVRKGEFEIVEAKNYAGR